MKTCYINVGPCWCLNLHKYCISLTLTRIFWLLDFYIQRVDCRYWSMKQIAKWQVIKFYSQYYSAWIIYMEMVTKKTFCHLTYFTIGTIVEVSFEYTVYWKIFAPLWVFFRSRVSRQILSELQCLSYVSLNIAFSGGIQDGAKLFKV